jgi:heat shock protein HslJ
MAVALAVVLGGCDITSRGGVPGTLEGSTWAAVSINGNPTAPGARPTLAFAGATVSGSDGCNQFAGTYRWSGSELAIGNLQSTAIGCPEPIGSLAAAYMEALGDVARLEVDRLGRIVLSGQGGEIVLEVAPQIEG